MSDAAESTLAPGTRVGGRFVLERLLRHGALCEVYLARSEGGGTARFEVRRVHGSAPAGGEVSVRNELERVASVGCRAIPALVGVEIDPAGLLVVTEAPEALAPRDTLTDLLKRDQRVAPQDAVRILREVARALDALHGLVPQVIHRALSPDNVLLMDRRRRVWLTESGLVHALTSAGVVSARASVVASGYSSPDELLNRATTRGDIFSFASLAYEMMSGRPAFQGASQAAVESALLRGPRPSVGEALSPATARLDAVLASAWSSDPQPAYARASELASALEAALEDRPAAAGVSTRTMIGLGTPASKAGLVGPRPAAPRAAPTSGLGAPPTAPRALPATQKVIVPQIHPPGTEPVSPVGGAESPRADSPPDERPTQPASALAAGAVGPEFNDVTRPVRIDVPHEAIAPHRVAPAEGPRESKPDERAERDSWESMLDASLPALENTAVLPPRAAAPVTPDELPTLVPEAPNESLLAVDEVEVESVQSEPTPTVGRSLPPPPPMEARRSLPPPAPMESRRSLPPPPPPPRPLGDSAQVAFDIDDDLEGLQAMAAGVVETGTPAVTADPAPELFSPEIEAPLAPGLLPEATGDEFAAAPPATPFEMLPSLFDGTDEVPSIPPPVASFPPPQQALSTAVETVPGAAPQRVVYPELTSAEANAVLASKSVKPHARFPVMAALGSVALLLAAGAAGVVWYRSTRPPSLRPPVATALDASTPATDVLAAATTAPDAFDVIVPQDDVLRGDAGTDSEASADALATETGPAAVLTDDVLALRDVSSAMDSQPAVPPVLDAGATPVAQQGDGGLVPPVIRREPMRGHPRQRESRALEDAMYDEVLRCAATSHRRRVRVSVRYLGETGLADRVRVAAPYGDSPSGDCIEAVIRRHPVGRFTSVDWETYFVFDPDEG